MLATPARTRISGLKWVDRLKGVAMLWVVLNHVVERLAGGNYAGDPTGDWPPLAGRIAQFTHAVRGYDALDVPLTALRDLGWLADQAVTIFIILGGFGLTLGLLAAHAGPALETRAFYNRRLRRIYPLWWGAHLLFLPTGFVFASGLSTGDWQFYLSLLGLRSVPSVFYYFSSSWWYVGVLIQLYLVFPLLWWIVKTRGPLALLALTWGAGFLALAIGHAAFGGELVEMWQRGIFAVTRLPEFAFGMVLAVWWVRDPARSDATLRRPAVRVAAVAAYAAGFALSFTLPGMIVAPTLLGIAAIVLLYPLVAWRATGRGALEFVGRHSFTIYLTHQFIFTTIVRPAQTVPVTAALLVLAALATAGATLALERGTDAVAAAFGRFRAARGPLAARGLLAGAALALVASPVAAEIALRTFAPQDVSRWSERSALEPDRAFGWRLIPSQTMTLQRRTAYRITSNALGFPGPEVADRRPQKSTRIFVVGDAISSAEGLDTRDAWPRLLETELARRLHRSAEVANFSVSGYGPNQEARVVQRFAPRYRPDAVLIAMYPDDVEDVLTDTATFRRLIGFDRPAPSDVRDVAELSHLRTFLPQRLLKPLSERFQNRASTEGYALGQFVYLERGHDDWDNDAIRQSAERYRDIAAAARKVGARTILVFIPGPAQLCGPGRLAYYPAHVTVADLSQYDVELPDRRARRIAAAAELPLWNLHADLRALPGCPYAARDRHLRPETHRAVAAFVARRLGALAGFDPAAGERGLRASHRAARHPSTRSAATGAPIRVADERSHA